MIALSDLDTSNAVWGTFGWGGGGKNGATVYAWKASRFTGTPAFNSGPPDPNPADAGPVVTSNNFGGPGSFLIECPTAEPYWLSFSYGAGAAPSGQPETPTPALVFWALYPNVGGSGDGGSGVDPDTLYVPGLNMDIGETAPFSLNFQGPLVVTVIEAQSPYTIPNGWSMAECDCTGGAILLEDSAPMEGDMCTVVKIDSTGSAVTCPDGTTTITTQGHSITQVFDGTTWSSRWGWPVSGGGSYLPSTDDLSAIASANATAANVAMNSHKLTGLSHGTASGDSVAYDQLGTAAFDAASAFDAAGAASTAQSTAETFATSAVATETTRAEAAEGTNATAISTETSRAEAAEALKAPLASPALTGSPTAPTQTTGDSSTKIATDAFVATAAAAVVTSSNQKASNLSDVADAGTSRANLHIPVLTPAACVATANVTSLSGLNTYDGYTLAVGDLVLLTAQTTASQNGLWTAAAGSWTRPTEFATGLVVKGRTCAVLNGTINGGTVWVLKAPTAGITVDTSSQTWTSRFTYVPSDVIEGIPITVYGDSYTASRGGPTYATRNWLDRVISRCRSAQGHLQGTSFQANNVVNGAVSGWMSVDACVYAYGTFTAAAGGGSAIAGTWANSAFQGGLVIPWLGRNDAGYDGKTTDSGTSTKHQAGFQNAMVALMRLFRASARIEDTNSDFVYTGTWAANTGQTICSSGTNHATTTPASYATITTPVGTDFDLVVMGIDNGGGTTGAAFTVTVDGVSWTPSGYPTTVGNQMSVGILGNTYCQMAIPLHGLSNAAHTVVITHAGSSGQYLMIDCLLQQSASPPTLFVPQICHVGAAGYAEYVTLGGTGASSTVDDTYNGIINTIVALFPSDGSVVTVNPNTAGWTPTYGAGGHLSSGDAQSLHPNDAGMAFLADLFMGTVLNALTAREGLVTV